ncbi:MAG: DUF554 domain-containing protein [Firmicutes bacterium]|nr:DUF554 domain-containing protein [Bacillota bacterium]
MLRLLGAAVNAAGVLMGSLLGLIWGARLPLVFRQDVMRLIGLAVAILGISMALPFSDPVNTLLSLVIGAWIGYRLDLGAHLERWGKALEARVGQQNIMQGFITAAVIFNVGAMAIVGSLQAGLTKHPTLLETKAVLDGMTAMVLTSAFGWGVLLAAPVTFAYEGGLSLAAGLLHRILVGPLLTDVSVVGGVLIAGIGINFLLEKTAVNIPNLLPALVFTVILGWLKQHGLSFV